ncbi:MAG: NAD(P)H-binding protein [Isosphaerales bacterium]
MSVDAPILVTGAAGRVGGVGRDVVEILRQRNLPVRALVRREDERAEALRAMGAEVVVADLTCAADVARALEGCRRMYFGMSVSAPYVEATVTAAAVARQRGNLEVFVNISQMTVSQMSLTAMTDSPQQRQHWLAEQVLNWSGLPVVHLRATVFLQNFFFSAWAAESIARDATIRLPFGSGRTSPVDGRDVAEVIAAVLSNPTAHIGKVYELTGPWSQDMHAIAAEYSDALRRTITYVDVPLERWRDQELRSRNLPEHVFEHLLTMARLHAANRYDRLTHDIEAITGRHATSIRDYVAKHSELFGPISPSTKVPLFGRIRA